MSYGALDGCRLWVSTTSTSTYVESAPELSFPSRWEELALLSSSTWDSLEPPVAALGYLKVSSFEFTLVDASGPSYEDSRLVALEAVLSLAAFFYLMYSFNFLWTDGCSTA